MLSNDANNGSVNHAVNALYKRNVKGLQGMRPKEKVCNSANGRYRAGGVVIAGS